MRGSLSRSVLVLVLAAGMLWVAPAAQAGGPNSPVLVTTGQVIGSESSGDPIQVDSGSWLLFRTGQSVADQFAADLQSISIEIVLDGESLAVETVTEDFGVVCVEETCADATVLWGYASSPPLSPGSLHTVTYRHTASAAGQDGFGSSWEAGVIFESTGTLLAGKAPLADPFVGGWLATDGDGSQVAYFIDAPVDGVYLVELYDQGGAICGDPGSRTPTPPPWEDVPTEPARIAGLGSRDESGALAWDFASIFCLDEILGPYRVLQSDLDPNTPEEEDGPISGSQRLIYDPALDTLQLDGDTSVYHRTRATSVEELLGILAHSD